jgi:acetyl esterase/lipase
MQRTRLRYGDHRSQVGDLWLPTPEARRFPTVVLIHGGFWRGLVGRRFMTSLASEIARQGLAVWNIEYRRVGLGGGWPITLSDVGRAVDFLSSVEAVDPERVVTCGHSAGGHLALWAAGRDRELAPPPDDENKATHIALKAAIALAGISDLKMAADLNLGNGAVIGLLGGRFDQVPERYRESSPLEMLPLGVPQVLLHGLADDVVPPQMSESYVERAIHLGDAAKYVPLEGLGHRDLIATTGTAPRALLEHLKAALG